MPMRAKRKSTFNTQMRQRTTEESPTPPMAPTKRISQSMTTASQRVAMEIAGRGAVRLTTCPCETVAEHGSAGLPRMRPHALTKTTLLFLLQRDVCSHNVEIFRSLDARGGPFEIVSRGNRSKPRSPMLAHAMQSTRCGAHVCSPHTPPKRTVPSSPYQLSMWLGRPVMSADSAGMHAKTRRDGESTHLNAMHFFNVLRCARRARKPGATCTVTRKHWSNNMPKLAHSAAGNW